MDSVFVQRKDVFTASCAFLFRNVWLLWFCFVLLSPVLYGQILLPLKKLFRTIDILKNK